MNKTADLNFSIHQWILVSVRSFCLVLVLGSTYLFDNLLHILSAFIPFQIWKRYISCLINLIMNRMVFLILGFFRFDCENFGFFSKDSQKITLKSGFIGIATHKNIIDFLYYSYIFNPVFVRIIIIVEKFENGLEIVKEINYAPLNYIESLRCAVQNRGFDPIIVKNEKQLKNIKYRKMNMKTLVSQCFQQFKGPIFILLPGLQLNEHVQIEQKIMDDIFENEVKFSRSGVGLKVQFDQRTVYERKFKNQIYFLFNLMSEVKINHLNITALVFRNYKYQYHKETFRSFIEKNFFLINPTVNFKEISYIQYIEQLNGSKGEQAQKQQGTQAKKQ